MFQKSKVLIVILSISFVIIFAEILYYFFSQTPQKNLLTAKIVNTTPSPTPGENEAYAGKPMFSTSETPGVAEYAPSYLATLSKGVLASSVLKNEFHGTITSVDRKGGTLPFRSYFPYSAAITIQGKELGSNTFWYNENNLKHLKVFTLVGEKENLLTLPDLQEGNEIIITETVDLTKDFEDNRTDIQIRKL